MPTNGKIFFRKKANTKSTASEWKVLRIGNTQLETKGIVSAQSDNNTVLVSFRSYPYDVVYSIDTSEGAPTVIEHHVPDNFVVDEKGLLYIDNQRKVMRLSLRTNKLTKVGTLKKRISPNFTHVRLVGEVGKQVIFYGQNKRDNERLWFRVDDHGALHPLPTHVFNHVSASLIRGDVLWFVKNDRQSTPTLFRWTLKRLNSIPLAIPFAPVITIDPCLDKERIIVQARFSTAERTYAVPVTFTTDLKASPTKRLSFISSSKQGVAASGNNTLWLGTSDGSLKKIDFP